MHPAEVEILLIEDNHDEAALTIRGLRKQNLANNLLHLDDGEEALEFIFGEGRHARSESEFRPKLILLDLKLPKVDGLSILRLLKGNERTRTIPVVILTSSKEESDIVESYKLGVNSYIVKPVNFESFSRAVAELGFYWLLLNEKSEK
jgi:CheY-like chemotaxis protein